MTDGKPLPSTRCQSIKDIDFKPLDRSDARFFELGIVMLLEPSAVGRLRAPTDSAVSLSASRQGSTGSDRADRIECPQENEAVMKELPRPRPTALVAAVPHWSVSEAAEKAWLDEQIAKTEQAMERTLVEGDQSAEEKDLRREMHAR